MNFSYNIKEFEKRFFNDFQSLRNEISAQSNKKKNYVGIVDVTKILKSFKHLTIDENFRLMAYGYSYFLDTLGEVVAVKVDKPIQEIYQTIDEDYINQNNATLTIFGTSKIIYAKDYRIKELQEYSVNKFAKSIPNLNEDEAKEQVSIINNRMEKLKKYAEKDDPSFENLYHLTIDKIRRFYHKLIGTPWIETSKGFRVYVDENYRKAFCIDKIPEQVFIDLYFMLFLIMI